MLNLSEPGPTADVRLRTCTAASALQKHKEAQATAHVVLHGVAAAMADGAPTELVAREFVELLLTTGCVYTARAMSRTSGTLDRAVSSELNVTVKGPGDGGNNVQHATDQRLAVGTGEQRATELVFTPKSDVESVASLRAVRLLLNCIEELRQARKEREHKATLWPIEDLPNADDRKVVSGQMRDLMDYARRIARYQGQRPDHRRERHRQGDRRPRHPRLLRSRRRSPSSPSTAPPSRATCSRASCSATAAARSPAPTAISSA